MRWRAAFVDVLCPLAPKGIPPLELCPGASFAPGPRKRWNQRLVSERDCYTQTENTTPGRPELVLDATGETTRLLGEYWTLIEG